MSTTSYSNWDFYNYHVNQEHKAGQFVNAESTLVAAGPPKSDDAQGGNGGVYPIGVLEQVAVQQSKQLQRIFEIGSSRSYFVPGRVVGSLNIGRTFYFGPSLLRVLYAYYRQDPTERGIEFGTAASDAKITRDGIEMPDPNAALLNLDGEPDLHEVRRNPGEDFFFIDLASDLFNQPTGMAIYFKDSNSVSVGAMYLENCYVQSHQMSISSGSVLIMEGSSLQFEQMVPIKML